MHHVIDVHALAYWSAMTVPDVQRAGRIVFDQLSGDNQSLRQMVIDSCAAVGLEPVQVLSIINAIAEDLRAVEAEAAGARTVKPRADQGSSDARPCVGERQRA